ncbi:MAG: chloride channel protein [Anaerolineaceae bacterium]|nr:chloride channel protein [Anaerolineaceae bacterium]
MIRNQFIERINQNTTAAISRFWSSETAVMVTFAILVGVGTGLGTIAFVRMIGFMTHLFFGGGLFGVAPYGLFIVLLPVIGGLIVGPLIYYIAPEAKGHGVPEVLTAIATHGGRIRPIVVLVKALGSAITIGSGGSVGREGPIVQIGAALGSTIGQVFKMNERRIITLVASGAAAGIAATFNAPIAGVMFAVEILLGDFGIQNLSTLVVSAVTASVVSRAVLGSSPAFSVPAYAMNSNWELLMYLGLGIVGGLGATLFVKTLYFAEDLFDNWKFPPYLKPAVGGLGLGLVGYFLPQVFGTGFETIGDVLAGRVGLAILLLLILGKILAMALTLGSGASGGVFAPALFTGAVLGGAYGQVMQMAFPGVPAPSGAYAMVGMAAVFAGAARAPITAILILFEMTQDYRIILPLMFATVVSTVLANWMEPESVYTLKLKLRGIDLQRRRNLNVLGSIRVRDAMTPKSAIITIPMDASLEEVSQLFQSTGHHGFIVVDERDELYGVVTLSDLERALHAQEMEGTAGEICTRNVITVCPDESLDEALRQFGSLDVGRIPVVERANSRCVVGMLRRGDIVHALSNALVEAQKVSSHMNRLRMENTIRAELTEMFITNDDYANGKRLSEIPLLPDCVIVSVQRGKKVIVPRGYTQLLVGDRVIALVGNGEIGEFKQALREGPPPEPDPTTENEVQEKATETEKN